MSAEKTANWAYCEDFIVEDDCLTAARGRAEELGAPHLSPGAASALHVLTTAIGATNIVEIGTSAGVNEIWLHRAMADGMVTSIDAETEFQRAAKTALSQAGVPTNHTRLINSRPADVLPRLADDAYDLALLGGDPLAMGAHVEPALRVLRPGGLLVVAGALWHDRVADPARRDPASTAMREIGRGLRELGELASALLPCGDGLLIATRRP